MVYQLGAQNSQARLATATKAEGHWERTHQMHLIRPTKLNDQLNDPTEQTRRAHQKRYGIDGDGWSLDGNGEPDAGGAARHHRAAAKQKLSEREH